MPTVYIIESDITAIWPHQFIFNINPVVQDKHQLKILRHLNGFSPKPNDVVVIWFQADGCLHANKLDFVSKLAFDPTFDEIQIFVGVQPGYAREMLPKGYMDQNKKRKTSGRVTMITPPERAAFSILVEQVKNYLLGPNSEELSQKVDLLEGCKDRYLTTDTIEAYQPNDSNFLVTIYGSCKRTAYRPKIMNILTEKYHGDKDVFVFDPTDYLAWKGDKFLDKGWTKEQTKQWLLDRQTEGANKANLVVIFIDGGDYAPETRMELTREIYSGREYLVAVGDTYLNVENLQKSVPNDKLIIGPVEDDNLLNETVDWIVAQFDTNTTIEKKDKIVDKVLA